VSLSSRLFLVDADDALHRLPVSAYHRLLQPESTSRLPGFAGHRARLASVVVEVAGSVVLGVRRLDFDVLDFDADGRVDARRYGAQQVARMDSMMSAVLGEPTAPSGVIDATDRFRARGGTWKPGPELRGRIEAAACGRVPTPRVRVVG
jgi:hypothetical protein